MVCVSLDQPLLTIRSHVSTNINQIHELKLQVLPDLLSAILPADTARLSPLRYESPHPFTYDPS